MLLTVPVEHKDLAITLQSLVAGVASKAEQAGRVGGSVDCAEIERELPGHLAAVGKATNKEVLQALEVEAARLVVDGKTYQLDRARSRQVSHLDEHRDHQPGPVPPDRCRGRQGRRCDQPANRCRGQEWLPGTAEAMPHICSNNVNQPNMPPD